MERMEIAYFRRVQTTGPKLYQNCQKNLTILKCPYHIWIHQEKRIQISINMPGFGSVIFKIVFKIWAFLRRQAIY